MSKTKTIAAAGVLAVAAAAAAACGPLPYGCHSYGRGITKCWQQGGGPTATQAIPLKPSGVVVMRPGVISRWI